MNTSGSSPLGREVAYPDRVDASILYAIARARQRDEFLFAGGEPFHGQDIWTAYELSWLNPRGKPRVAIATLRVPCDSPSMIESKSLKLYLNGFAHARFADVDALADRLTGDLSVCCGAQVDVELWSGETMDAFPTAWLSGTSIDDLDIDLPVLDAPDASLLAHASRPGVADERDPESSPLRASAEVASFVDGREEEASGDEVEESLVSRVFRSNCPVTGQPDWADIQVRYRGAPIDHASLLAYLVSYRNHCGFHEHCVERIFLDIKTRCAPLTLTVYARFTRRGGLDINPWRSDEPGAIAPENVRTARQ